MKIVIAGAGAVGTHLSKLLSRDHQDCVLIDPDLARDWQVLTVVMIS